MALLQVGLGIATLLAVVPVPLAALHQAGAVTLLSLVVWSLHDARGDAGRVKT
jgi:cytochrome c oxidase assembly protein subunit 15